MGDASLADHKYGCTFNLVLVMYLKGQNNINVCNDIVEFVGVVLNYYS